MGSSLPRRLKRGVFFRSADEGWRWGKAEERLWKHGGGGVEKPTLEDLKKLIRSQIRADVPLKELNDSLNSMKNYFSEAQILTAQKAVEEERKVKK